MCWQSWTDKLMTICLTDWIKGRLDHFFLYSVIVPLAGWEDVCGCILDAPLHGVSVDSQSGIGHRTPLRQPLAGVAQPRNVPQGQLSESGLDTRLPLCDWWDQAECRGGSGLQDRRFGGSITSCSYPDVHLVSSQVSQEIKSCPTIGVRKGTWYQRVQGQVFWKGVT